MFKNCFRGSKEQADDTPRPSDDDILHYENELRKEQAASTPLVSPSLPLSILLDEYATSTTAFAAKLEQLQRENGFHTLRKCRRDGNCFYRAIAFALLEHFRTHRTDTDRLRSDWNARLKTVGFEPAVFEDFSDAFWTAANDMSVHTDGDSLAAAWTADEYSSDMAIVYMRLLASAEMRARPEEYAAFIEDSPDVIKWCERNVDAVGVDADQVQMMALSRALALPIVVANLGGGAGDDDLQVTEFVAEGETSPLPVPVALLYRPGHYDLLYK